MTQPKHDASTPSTLQPRLPRASGARSFARLFPSKVETVISYWLTRGDCSFERWDLAPDTLVVNRRNKSIRFGVRAVGPVTADPFEVVIRDTAKGWVFKADCWEEPEMEYPLRVFESPHSVLFVCSDEWDQIYFHVERAG